MELKSLVLITMDRVLVPQDPDLIKMSATVQVYWQKHLRQCLVQMLQRVQRRSAVVRKENAQMEAPLEMRIRQALRGSIRKLLVDREEF